MTNEILCPSCSKRLRVNPQSKSRRLRCPVCQTEMSLSVSGETVTAKVYSTAPMPEPPPLRPPPIPPPLRAEREMERPAPLGNELLLSEAARLRPDVAPAAEPPAFQVSLAPRPAARRTSTERSKPGKKAAGKSFALWIGGGIGLVLVAALAVGGFLLLRGLPDGTGTTVAKSLKTSEAKNEVAVGGKQVPKEPVPALEPEKTTKQSAPPVNTGPLQSFPPTADFSPPGTILPDETFTGPLPKTPDAKPDTTTAPPPQTPAPLPDKSAKKPAPESPVPEKPAAEPGKAPLVQEKTKPDKASPKTSTKKTDTKKPDAKGPPPATSDCEVCRGQGVVPLKKPQPYVWMEGQPVPKGAVAVREKYCPNCLPDADNAELAAKEDVRLKTAMDVHLGWEKKTSWKLVRAETRRTALHSQLPPADTQRVALALEAMNQHIEGLTGSVELTDTTPANCNVIILFQKPNYLQFVNLLKADPVFGPARQDWSLVRDVAGTWVKDTIFYQHASQSAPPEHQAIALVASFQLRTASGYKDPPWLNVGYAAYCENRTLKSNRVTSLEYALTNLQIDPDWSLAVRRLAAAGGLKPWNDMFPKLLRDYKAEDHLTAYAMVAFLIQYKPKCFLDFVLETKNGLGNVEALEKAYGEKVPELQQRWVKALGGK